MYSNEMGKTVIYRSSVLQDKDDEEDDDDYVYDVDDKVAMNDKKKDLYKKHPSYRTSSRSESYNITTYMNVYRTDVLSQILALRR